MPRAYYERGIALSQLGRHAEALASLDQAIKIDGELSSSQKSEVGLSPSDISAANKRRGYVLFKLQRYGEAVQAYDVYLSSVSEMDDACVFRGIAEWKLGQLEKARSDAATVLEADPRLQINFSGDHALEIFDLDKRMATAKMAIEAARAAEAAGHWTDAFQEWNRAYLYCSGVAEDGPATRQTAIDGVLVAYGKLEVKPATPELARKYSIQAEAYFAEKDYVHAIKAYEKAIGIAPWSPRERFNLALLLGEQQQYQGAIYNMQAYLKLLPGADDARAAQDKIYVWQGKSK